MNCYYHMNCSINTYPYVFMKKIPPKFAWDKAKEGEFQYWCVRGTQLYGPFNELSACERELKRINNA